MTTDSYPLIKSISPNNRQIRFETNLKGRHVLFCLLVSLKIAFYYRNNLQVSRQMYSMYMSCGTDEEEIILQLFSLIWYAHANTHTHTQCECEDLERLNPA